MRIDTHAPQAFARARSSPHEPDEPVRASAATSRRLSAVCFRPGLLVVALVVVLLASGVVAGGEQPDAAAARELRPLPALAAAGQLAAAVRSLLADVAQAFGRLPLIHALGPPAFLAAAAFLPRIPPLDNMTEAGKWAFGGLCLLAAMGLASRGPPSAGGSAAGGGFGGSLRRAEFVSAVEASLTPVSSRALTRWVGEWEDGHALGAAVHLILSDGGDLLHQAVLTARGKSLAPRGAATGTQTA